MLGDITVGAASKVGSNVSLREPVEREALVQLDPEVRKLIIRYANRTADPLPEPFDDADLPFEVRRHLPPESDAHS